MSYCLILHLLLGIVCPFGLFQSINMPVVWAKKKNIHYYKQSFLKRWRLAELKHHYLTGNCLTQSTYIDFDRSGGRKAFQNDESTSHWTFNVRAHIKFCYTLVLNFFSISCTLLCFTSQEVWRLVLQSLHFSHRSTFTQS